MTEPKFTKGPWYVYNNGFYLEITNENGQEAPTMSICDIHYKNIFNANLIAAAPDMYEALMEHCLDCPLGQDDQSLCDSCHIGHAIRKARGEEE